MMDEKRERALIENLRQWPNEKLTRLLEGLKQIIGEEPVTDPLVKKVMETSWTR